MFRIRLLDDPLETNSTHWLILDDKYWMIHFESIGFHVFIGWYWMIHSISVLKPIPLKRANHQRPSVVVEISACDAHLKSPKKRVNSKRAGKNHHDKVKLSCRIGLSTLRVVLFWRWCLHRLGGVLCETWQYWILLRFRCVPKLVDHPNPVSQKKATYPSKTDMAIENHHF